MATLREPRGRKHRRSVEHLRAAKTPYTDDARAYQAVKWQLQDGREPFPHQVEAVSLDGSSIYASVLIDGLPKARLCLDPFHVTKWVNEALDKVYAAAPARPMVWNKFRLEAQDANGTSGPIITWSPAAPEHTGRDG